MLSCRGYSTWSNVTGSQTKCILSWAITCPAAIGCFVILLMMPEEHYISQTDKGGVSLRPSQLCGGVYSFHLHVMGINTKFSQLWTNYLNFRQAAMWIIINGTLSRLNIVLFSAANSIPYQKICLLQELAVQSTENIITPSPLSEVFVLWCFITCRTKLWNETIIHTWPHGVGEARKCKKSIGN